MFLVVLFAVETISGGTSTGRDVNSHGRGYQRATMRYGPVKLPGMSGPPARHDGSNSRKVSTGGSDPQSVELTCNGANSLKASISFRLSS